MNQVSKTKYVQFYELLEKSMELTYGRWGKVYRSHLLETNPEKYYLLLSMGKLYDHISEVDIRMYNKYNELVRSLCESKGLTKELKKKEPEKWTKLLEPIESKASKTIEEEIMKIK